MITIYDFKPKFQQVLKPLMRWLVKNKISPNMVTTLALAGSILVGILPILSFFKLKLLLILPFWLLIRMALNAIDGMMAREFNMCSYNGFILNELGDIISDTALYLPLIFIAPACTISIIFFNLGAIFTEICGILPKAAGLKRHYEGPMGKSDRAFAVGSLAIITVLFPKTLIFWDLIFIVLFILTLITCKNRVEGSLKERKGE